MSLTPMMKQYLEIKEQYPDTLLMFRLGDFYELFFDDAKVASKTLEITLTGRDAGESGRAPMCGVPYHAAEQYISKLIDSGFRVAICEQMEDPKSVKGLVKREVVRVVTPGTVLRDEGGNNRFLGAVVRQRQGFGIAVVDVGTGEVWCGQDPDVHGIQDVLLSNAPAELLVYEGEDGGDIAQVTAVLKEARQTKTTRLKAPRDIAAAAMQAVCAQYQVPNLVPLGLADVPAAVAALGLALQYVQDTQKLVPGHLRGPKNLQEDQTLQIGQTAQTNLEVLETQRTRQRKGSLLGLLDKTKTSMGSRLLRRWIERPLVSVVHIEERLDAVESFSADLFLRSQTQQLLDDVYDLERLIGKVSFGSATARDLLAVAKSLRTLPELKKILLGTHSSLLQRASELIPDLSALEQKISNQLVDDPPVSVRDGGMFREGVDPELDRLREAKSSGKTWLASLEQRERDATGIKSLKIGFNKVFGYYIEVSKANMNLVPAHYERRQTLSGAERYVLPELKEQEALILHAQERAMEYEYELFMQLRNDVLLDLQNIQAASEQIAIVDALCSLGQASAEHRYVRPVLTEDRGITIVAGRHPVVEGANPGRFVPNDVRLDDEQTLLLITGPNMAGKSTYMRQVALIVLMAHIGCFVPAQSARIGLVDRIFTRIGASDDLGAGQSTFMVEMVELAHILRMATDRSLVLLDEIGRGTSTYDGLSIAEAVMEALLVPGRSPLTLFATHYHELTEAARKLPKTANYSVSVQETPDGIEFLHSVIARPADKSYGIQVARLAGIPRGVIERASELLQLREVATNAAPEAPEAPEVPQPPASGHGQAAAAQERDLPLFAHSVDLLVERLAGCDILNMTPLEALNALHQFTKEAKEVVQWGKSE